MDTIRQKSIEFGGEIFAERRATPRRRVFKGAKLSFNNGYSALECVVRNESDTGALLAFGETAAVPYAFDLTINGSDVRRSAHVCWRTSTLVGVAFAQG